MGVIFKFFGLLRKAELYCAKSQMISKSLSLTPRTEQIDSVQKSHKFETLTFVFVFVPSSQNVEYKSIEKLQIMNKAI